jgi:uncharacterized protein (TIGR00369 family)
MHQRIQSLRASGDPARLADAIPYASFVGITLRLEDGKMLGVMPFADHIVGNPALPALHGGTLGSLLESTAIFTVLWEVETESVPKTINITVDYLRSARPENTFAQATITKLGRRVINVRVLAWQSDRDKPVALATANFLLKTEID